MFGRLGLGPVIRKDGFVVENEIWLASGERAATVRSTGGWLDLRERKLVTPPPALFAAFAKAPRHPDFAELPPARSG